MNNVVLHPYQQTVKAEIYRDWDIGHKNVLAVMPTGAGKSVVVTDIVLDGAIKGLTQAVMAHRNELVTQMSCHVAKRGIPHKIIGADSTVAQTIRAHRALFGRSFVNNSARTSVVGVDTLISRQDLYAQWAIQHDRWITDEAHHAIGDESSEGGTPANKWGRAIGMFKNAKGLGVTATPQRADGLGLGRHADGVFDSMVLGPSMRFLINNKFLAEYDIVCPESDMVADEDKKGASGDWSNQYLKGQAEKSHIVGDVAINYCKYALGRQAIVFATDIETAGKIAARFYEFGIKAAALSSKTPTAVREKYIAEFRNGTLKVLVNVDLFDEGFDVPACDVVIMARPTASLGKYLQMVGRCLRYIAGKVALIIDHVSNIVRHHFPDQLRVWTLDRRDKRGKSAPDPNELKLTVCTCCSKPYERFMPACPHCGFTKPLPEPGSRTIEMVEGDLILLDHRTLAKMREATVLPSAADMAQKVGAVAGPVAAKGAANKQIEKIAAHNKLSETIAQWAAVERQKGYNDQEIYRRFYLTLGVDVASALRASQTRVEIEKISEIIEGWYK